jgi:hypothetical protein
MAKKYLAELEQLWQQNRKGADSLFNRIKTFPRSPRLRRSKALRGSDLVRELARLAALTRDVRFQDALFALAEHRITDRNHNFLPWQVPEITQLQKKWERFMCASIHALKAQGASLRRACAEMAAVTGWEATSFAAATKHLELLYRQHPIEHFDPTEFKEFTSPETLALLEKAYSRDSPTTDPATELEKSCSTSIPTTADN